MCLVLLHQSLGLAAEDVVDPAVLVASSEKIKTELGWQPKFAELDQIISSAWEWHQKRYS